MQDILDTNTDNFGLRLRGLIEGKKLTIESFADDFGIARSTAQLWLKRAAPPLEKYWPKLAAYFSVSESFIATGIPRISDIKGGQVEEAIQAPYLLSQERDAEFKAYLAFIRAMREEAERLANGNITKAQEIFDRLLDSWNDHRETLAMKHEAALKAVLREPKMKSRSTDQSSPDKAQGGAAV